LGARACACSFCRRHNARTTSDPDGRVAFRVADDSKLNRYRFGLLTADFLICRNCGVYVAAVYSEQASSWATLNVNIFETAEGFPENPPAVFYEGESAAEKAARRKARWTPVVGSDESAIYNGGTPAGRTRPTMR
jgi:hypothetical protein